MLHYNIGCFCCLTARDSWCAEGRIIPIFTTNCNLLSIDDDETLAVRGLGRPQMAMGIYKEAGRMTSEQVLFGIVAMSEV
ncbi:hypothetical protein DID88_009924 [Monilinia fructigena]|uniref:Uncharacterized protein n=1 Tax=Monilinia fructigena TaxID=38457 RepID=A0A395IDN5_9HELO|nr:hypothetical protein DID88_009924 [Monilinia fructigena]